VDDSEIEHIRQIGDPVERARAVGREQSRLSGLIDELAGVRREAIDEMLRAGLSQSDIARELGVTRSRLNKLVTTGPGPERALLVPKPRAGALLTVAVVEKQESGRARPSVLVTTQAAAGKLERLAREMGLDTQVAHVSEATGYIDLNHDNLAVLVGPRTSLLVAQAITADPVIKWRKTDDANNNWTLIDTRADVEYRSEFDERKPTTSEPRTCYAHIGRIRRPDGDGTFLYLGGAHGAGTAGAVDYFVRNIADLWQTVHRNLWSAVVKTTASANGDEILSAELASPVYVHAKR
jgi:transcriptional regulator with XRE-family HTH domain